MSTSIIRNIKHSGLTIYEDLADRTHLFLPPEALQKALSARLVGMSLKGYENRTRSKIVKTAICTGLGYPAPSSFKRIRPRFPSQNFDAYVQKSDNLQIWNDVVSLDRRYVLIRVNDALQISAVRVVTGEVIKGFETTGAFTVKYQARAQRPPAESSLLSPDDTPHARSVAEKGLLPSGGFLPLPALYNKLRGLIGKTIPNPGVGKERTRSEYLRDLVEPCLGGKKTVDNGQFPDLPGQLLELKLQLEPTIDLGLVIPDATEPMRQMPYVRPCDVRYAVFYGTVVGTQIKLDKVIVSTGEKFFSFFQLSDGLVANRKLQIKLPANFFS
jgi:hypothetical protein